MSSNHWRRSGGNDVLVGSAGRDRLVGSSGIDILDVGDAFAFPVTMANLATGKAVLDGDGIAFLSGIENVFGDRGDDAITGDLRPNENG